MDTRPAYLVLDSWAGRSSTLVVVVGATPKRFRIRAITPTRLGGCDRYIQPGEEALVPRTAVVFGGRIASPP
jgi:hypothetical protein